MFIKTIIVKVTCCVIQSNFVKMWFYFLFAILTTFDFAMASSSFDFGDTVTLILGLIIGIIGFFACMGTYARHRNRMETMT